MTLFPYFMNGLLGRNLVPQKTVDDLGPIRMSSVPSGLLSWVRGRRLFFGGIIFFVLLDLLLAIIYAWYPSLIREGSFQSGLYPL